MRILFLLASLLYASVAAATDAGDLHRAIASACQCGVIGVSIGDPVDRNTWKVQYAPAATANQQATGNAALAAFDINASPIPQEISAMQAKVALSRAGLLTQVQNWINTQDAETQLVWSSASVFHRDSAIIVRGAAALGLTQQQLNQLFTTALAIKP